MEQPYRTGTRLTKKGKPSIIRWRGLMCGIGRQGRVMTFIALTVLIASLSFTQLGFIGVGMQGKYAGYCIMLLAPIAFGALMLGVLPGTLLGLAAGVLLSVHSGIQPLDYYEMNFVTPTLSIALFTVAAFFLGLFLAIALRKEPPLRRRIVYFILISVFVSVMFSSSFTVNVFIQLALQLADIASRMGVELSEETVRGYATTTLGQFGSIGLQILIDAVLVFGACVIGEVAVRKVEAARGGLRLGTRFRAWLLLVFALVFVVVAAVGFVVITEQAKGNAKQNMNGEIDYIKSQLRAYGLRSESLAGFLAADAQSSTAVSEAEAGELESVFSLESLLEGYSKEADGTIVVFADDVVLLSDDPCYEVGSSADDYVNPPELQEAIFLGVPDGEMLQISYDEEMLVEEDVRAAEESDFLSRPVSAEVAFACFGRYGDYTIMMITPASEVFAGRNATMAWLSLSALVLLVAVFLLVSRLLTVIVVRRIDETNGVLGEITGGNLEARVDVGDSREFASLSEGINTTVDALKGWIAEAEQRMDAELTTAKAIQESALPRVFPPYPDIPKFDVFATMQAAREVGGDFYDFFLIGEDAGPDAGKLGFVIADVSGKGVPAALFMMKAMTQLRDYLMSGVEVGEAVENANRQLCEGNDKGMFVTVWAGVLDYATGRVDFANAGHNPPLLWQEGGGWRWLEEKSGMPLGLFDVMPYEAHSVECGVGDQLLLYTDGVTEAMNMDGELYGEDRLEALAAENAALHPRQLVEAVRNDVALWADGAEQSDDITILALAVGMPPQVTETLELPAEVDELPRVNDFIHSELDRRLCPKRVQNQLDIAVEELFVNVCHYAYPEATPESPGSVRIRRTYSAEPPSVIVEIEDSGVPYNPLDKPDAVAPDNIEDVPIGGLGILMAKKCTDEMRYERVDGCNVVTIVKKW